ncbi:MAG: type II toxin-antitoxin system RelE/ParE family toxin [Spirulina sp.]
MLRVIFLPPAESELGEAIDYYEAQKPGLGSEFFEEVWATIERIQRYPEAWQLISPNARRCRLSRFPYGVIYRVRDDGHEILIVALSHLHREPNYWRNRL